MKRVLVIGSGGAGKSTLARRLGEALQLEVIHLDVCYWQPGWIEPPKAAWLATVTQLVQRESWIIDGNYSGTLALRLAACDTVIFLDLPPWLCVWRVLKRAVRYRQHSRPDMAAGCPEHINGKFLLWVWRYRRDTRPKIVELIEQQRARCQVVWLRSTGEVEEFLARFKANPGRPQ